MRANSPHKEREQRVDKVLTPKIGSVIDRNGDPLDDTCCRTSITKDRGAIHCCCILIPNKYKYKRIGKDKTSRASVNCR